MRWWRAGGAALGLWWAVVAPDARGQLPILTLPPDEPSAAATSVASSVPPDDGAPSAPVPPADDVAWPALPARGEGIEAFRQDLEVARTALERRRIAGEVDERTYAREMRRYYELYRAYRQRVR